MSQARATDLFFLIFFDHVYLTECDRLRCIFTVCVIVHDVVAKIDARTLFILVLSPTNSGLPSLNEMPITSSTSSKQLVCKPVLSDSIRKEGTQTRSAPVDTSASDTDTPSVIEKGRKKEGRQKQSDRNEHRKSGGVEGIRNISQASLLNTHSIETAGRASANDDSPGGNDQSDPGQQVKSKVGCFSSFC